MTNLQNTTSGSLRSAPAAPFLQKLFVFFQKPLVQLSAILLFTAVAITFLNFFTLLEYFNPSQLTAGQVSTQTIRAPRDLFLEDTLGTESERAESQKLVRRVFEFDDSATPGKNSELSSLFTIIDNYSSSPGLSDGKADLEETERVEIERSFATKFTPEEWEIVLSRNNWPELHRYISSLVYPILHRGIILDKAPLESVLARSGATLLRRDTGIETPLLSDALIYDLQEAKEVFNGIVSKQTSTQGPVFDSLVKKLGLWLLKPNVKFDRERTDKRLEAARLQVDKVFYQIRRGELLVRAGEKITPNILMKLESLSESRSRVSLVRSASGYFTLVALTLGLLFAFARKGWAKFRPGVSELLLISVTLVGTVAIERVGLVVGEALSFVISDVDPQAFSVFAPVAVGAIIIQAVLGTTYVTFFILSYTTIFSLLQQDFSAKTALFVFGSLVGSLMIKGASRRSAFLLTGVRIAITNVILCLTYSILFPQIGASSSIATIIASAAGGLASGVLALGLLPIIEYFGGYVTAIKLLELASLERPLLRELSMQAPGTWSHSMVMGQLCENAAEAIGARPLLTRVGAYYHDIGKAKKPLYFVENQAGKENKHDKLAPSMSALIIRSHVKDGIEMAKAANLPSALIDFIPQHHGTALIEYFYDKAAKEAAPGEIIDENLFRYPGPKPQTKEAGIIMLADNVEAISRVMSDPSPAKIQGMVQKVINRVFASGQLDESELTLKDLHHIAKCFSRVLTGIVHKRVEYPESSEKNTGDKKESEAIINKAPIETQAGGINILSNSAPLDSLKTDKSEKSIVDKNGTAENKETLRRLGI